MSHNNGSEQARIAGTAQSLRALETGVHECSLPTDLMEFEKTILASPAYQAVAALKPQETTLDWFLL